MITIFKEAGIKVGIGYANSNDFSASGYEAARKAFEHGNIKKPLFMLAFCAGGVDHDLFYRGLRQVAGDHVPIIGGSVIGIITNDILSYNGCPCGVLAVESDAIRISTAVADSLNISEYISGQRFASTLKHSPDDRALFIFYDSIKHPATPETPPVMNASAPLIEGFGDAFGTGIPIFGAGLVGDYSFSPTVQFCGTHVSRQCVTGMMLSGDFRIYNRITHGCTPLDGIYHTITDIRNDVIFSIDNRPAVEVIDELYGHHEWRKEHPLQLISIGINCGGKYDVPEESHYVNRLITGALPDNSGLGLFEADMEQGTQFQFMLRDNGEIINSASRNASGILDEIYADGRTPYLALYIDCAGRAAGYSNTDREEASEIQSLFNSRNIPLFGFYSGVEVAPFAGKSRGLDWTGVLIVFTDR